MCSDLLCSVITSSAGLALTALLMVRSSGKVTDFARSIPLNMARSLAKVVGRSYCVVKVT